MERYVKRSEEDIRNRIIEGCNFIRQKSEAQFPKVFQSKENRLNLCIEENGGHFEHLL